jgi:two-component system chemotaxis response regulator CheB
MLKQDIIVIGGSAGSITTLKQIVSTLSKDFKATIFIVVHIPADSKSILPKILSQAGNLQAVHPKDGEAIEPGKIYIAPNDHHIILEQDRILIKRGPKENRFRPSIDVLFRSAAFQYRDRVVGVILSGYLDDGVSGVWMIKQLGGIAVVQEPTDTEFPQLPLNVIENVAVDYRLKAIDMGPVLSGLYKKQVVPPVNEMSKEQLDLTKTEVFIAAEGNAFKMGIINMGELTPFTCPECNGALVRLIEGNLLRYRCHTGHAYTAQSLLSELSENTDTKLWQLVRGFEEMNLLLGSIADQYDKLNHEDASLLYKSKAKKSLDQSVLLREFIHHHEKI